MLYFKMLLRILEIINIFIKKINVDVSINIYISNQFSRNVILGLMILTNLENLYLKIIMLIIILINQRFA